MADVVKETHYHDDAAASSSNSGVITAVVVVVLILLALFFFSRGFGRSGNNTESGTSGTPNVQVEGGASGGASGTTGQ